MDRDTLIIQTGVNAIQAAYHVAETAARLISDPLVREAALAGLKRSHDEAKQQFDTFMRLTSPEGVALRSGPVEK
jgi:hypothetical protein